MAVGIWTCVDHSYIDQLLGTNLYMSAAIILIGKMNKIISYKTFLIDCVHSYRRRCGAHFVSRLLRCHQRDQVHVTHSKLIILILVKCLSVFLLQYFIVMFGIFVTMLVGGILGYAFRSNVALSMRTRMYSSLGEYGFNRAVTEAWDFTQSRVNAV